MKDLTNKIPRSYVHNSSNSNEKAWKKKKGFNWIQAPWYGAVPYRLSYQASLIVLVILKPMRVEFIKLWKFLLFNLFQFSALYLGSLAFVITGVIVYNLKPTPSRPSSTVTQSSLSYRQLEEDTHQSDFNSSLSSLQDHVTSVCCQDLRNVSE